MSTIQKIAPQAPKLQAPNFFQKVFARFGLAQNAKTDFAPKTTSPLTQLETGQQKAKDVADGIAVGGSEVAHTRGTLPFSKAKGFQWSMNPPPGWNGKSTSVVQVFKPELDKSAGSLKNLRLDHGPNVKTGGSNWHWNQKGVSQLFDVTNHAPLGKGMAAFGKIAGATKAVGKVLKPIGMISDAYDLVTSKDKPRTASKIAAGWGGAALGAKGGAGLGAAIGTAIFPGAGTVVGGFVGGLAGGIGGYFAGAKIGEKAYDFVKDNAGKVVDFAKNTAAAVQDKVGGFVSGAKDAIGGAFSSAKSFLGF